MPKPSIYFGAGLLAELETLFPDRGFHILRIPEISDADMRKIRSSLQGRVLSEVVYQQGMPDIRVVEDLQDNFWRYADCGNSVLLGMGGGSVMDAAKVLRFKPDGKAWLSRHLDVSIADQSLPKMPLLLASTTAGTGSEVTPTATIWDFENQCKHSFFGPQVLADVAIIDPRLCLGAPWIISRDAAIDALSHALEAIWNINRTKETDDLAINAAQKICRYLPLLRDDLNNLEYRQALSESALSAGMAMAKTQTALAHALSYAQTMNSKKTHGQACAYWLPYVWQLLIQSKCESKILISINQAIGEYFSTPTEMQEWLLALGFSVYPALTRDKTVEDQVNVVRLSARGKNFAGFSVNDK
ncbi:iron-containing alcohol dehydrogenase [Polynucleobacter necessarius]|uniref:iron-containing alcohol dehydrogenase n=1 Tax=Polynucleobacter necessarius TaxID=576610 RepID=UPI000E099EDD|nr:iron-containing alcohol dehydrogenase [Polynucleobacter necessarius]